MTENVTVEKTGSERYDPLEIEARWQARWEADGLYHVDLQDELRPPYYFLTMLPYPSGDLHIGHWFTMAPSDTRARYLRMRGYNVFFPIGFDAFGLPAENAAIKRNIHPKEWTYANIKNMRGQLRSMGAIFPWDHEAVTCDPEYYRWNQWFFVQMFRRGLAYRKFAPVDWCPSCNTTLAREQVVGEDRHCERCETPVIKKDLHQWLFKITDYAEELLDFSKLEWPERVQTLQRNWIGRSEGAEITFAVARANGTTAPVTVFTTRPDTLWGATFLVLAPEHPLVAEITTPAQQEAVAAYVTQTGRQSEIERLAEDREKTGVWTGATATNPATGESVPVWIADYVLLTYGTGAIMAVPAHDARDFAFARKYDLPIVPVIAEAPGAPLPDPAAMPESYTGAGGVMAHSGPIDGAPVGHEPGQSVPAAIAWLQAQGTGQGAVTYRLRDWLISRQRYWGTPIPIVYCPTCGTVPVPEDQLPVTLPDDVDFLPTGESPLKLHPTWRFTTCPECGGPGERDTDTMDTFVDSSWYQYRYLSPALRRGHVRPGGDALAARNLLHGRHRARDDAPAVHALLDEGHARHGAGALRRADDAAVQPGHHPGARRPAHEQEPRQRGRPGRPGAGLWRRRGALLPDVHRPLGPGRSVEQPGHGGHHALAGPRRPRWRRRPRAPARPRPLPSRRAACSASCTRRSAPSARIPTPSASTPPSRR